MVFLNYYKDFNYLNYVFKIFCPGLESKKISQSRACKSLQCTRSDDSALFAPTYTSRVIPTPSTVFDELCQFFAWGCIPPPVP